MKTILALDIHKTPREIIERNAKSNEYFFQ